MNDMVIGADSLARRLGDASPAVRPVVLDVRWALGGPPGRELYATGHIPGAVFIDLDHDLAGPPGPRGRHPLPDPDDFQAAMRRARVAAERTVAVYDDGSPGPAARAWWLLRYFGHPDVVVLDGGIAAWVAAGHPLEIHVPASSAPGDFVARPGSMQLLDAAGAAGLAVNGVLLDARSPERFRGDAEPIDAVAGHIPGAGNLPAAETVDEAGRLRDPRELRALFERHDVRDDRPAGAYCGSGVTAAYIVLALERAGLSGALYAGSWSEWICDPDRPISVDPA